MTFSIFASVIVNHPVFQSSNNRHIELTQMRSRLSVNKDAWTGQSVLLYNLTDGFTGKYQVFILVGVLT